MLTLKKITKDYIAGDTKVAALRGLDISFRRSEFVSVLGPSGCGKTTLLNLIGGLDQYSSGDLTINGRSTKDYKNSDWDAYRNHSVGFVFQTYNLIPHQTVLANVELALTLSGVSKTERRKKASDALEQVGLKDQMRKKPNQLSGGQMQRVAIARALVNDPDILLADEPTGALDTDTSIQVMDLLQEVSKDRLVVMVTHNPYIAEKYSTRIVRLLDGLVTGDSDPYDGEPREEMRENAEFRAEKPSMSLSTALSLSLNNLMTKKTRTFLTAFAGSIGIIGIAMILSLSTGFNDYITKVEEDTLSSYPISIEAETVDMGSLLQTVMDVSRGEEMKHGLDKVYSNNVMTDFMNAMLSEVQTNDLKAFMEYIENDASGIHDISNAVQYGYDMDLNLYKGDTSDGIVQVNPSRIFEDSGMPAASPIYSSGAFGGMGSVDVWEEMLGNEKLLNSQYEVLAGNWPSSFDEVVLIVDENNEISDMTLYTLGIRDQAELKELINKVMKGEAFESEQSSYDFDELLGLSFRLVPSAGYYDYSEEMRNWLDMREDEDYMASVIADAPDIKLVGIVRPTEDSVSTSMRGAIGYTTGLTEYVISATNNSEIVRQQIAAPETDVFTSLPFSNGEDDETGASFDFSALTPEQQAHLQSLTGEERTAFIKNYVNQTSSASTYEENLKTLGVTSLDNPSIINIYPANFESKEEIKDIIKDYNKSMSAEGKDEYIINYTDYVGLIMSSVSTIINTISYVLIAFVAISLIVSSIMIGIITYISVLERTKEIGILRSMGASKKDISRVFNAETIIVGFASGILGILITALLCIPMNYIIETLTDISGVASMPIAAAGALVVISMILTLMAGLIPSRIAAKKDPVVALRAE